MCRSSRYLKGFTLIELLVVIAIIAILAAILFPVFTNARDKAKLAKCMSHLKQCGAASLMYIDDYAGYFPACRITDNAGNTIRSWPEGQCAGGQAGRFTTANGGLGEQYSPAKYRPLNKYVKSIEFFHCPSEKRQDCAQARSTFPWLRFGSSYNFNVTFFYPTYPADFFYTLNKMNGSEPVGRKFSELKNSRRMIMMGERPIHYWYGVPSNTQNPTPLDDAPMLGHGGDKPWTPIVFCDGHVEYILMTPGISGKTWDLAQPEWMNE